MTTGHAWRALADETIRELAASGERFSSDDLIDKIGVPDQSHDPNARNNQVGSAFQTAKARGLIRMVGTTTSKQKHRKGGLIRVWIGAQHHE